MPRKKAFPKESSEKFLLLRGSEKAVNADGETLPNILVPVAKNYKPGTSLILSKIAAFTNLESDENNEEHKDIDGVFDDASTIEDSDVADGILKDLLSDTKKLKCLRISEEFEEDLLGDDYSDDYDDEGSECGQSESLCDPKSSENWKMFNQKFDKVMEEYDDDQIGSLDEDDDVCAMQMAPPESFALESEEFSKEFPGVLEDCDKELKERILNYVDDSEEEKIVEIVTEKPLEYDCESILSTYSNIYNHPAVVKEERIRRMRNKSCSSQTDCDLESMRRMRNKSYSSQTDSDSESVSSVLTSKCNVRKKGETAEERKERQRKFKEAKKIRRELKKQNKEAFKEEKKSLVLKSRQNAGMVLL